MIFGLDNWLAQADNNKTNATQKMVLSQPIALVRPIGFHDFIHRFTVKFRR